MARDEGTLVGKSRRPEPGWQRFVLRLIGAGLLVATGAIHLDLYLTGYRTIPTIGWLFLLQVITAFGLGALVLVSGSRLAAAAGAGFALSTLGGYLLSLRIGLFGFREVRTTAGIVAGVIEVVDFAALAALALGWGTQRQLTPPTTRSTSLVERLQANIPVALLGVRRARGSGRGSARRIRGGSGTNPNERCLDQPAPKCGQDQRGLGPDQCPGLHAVLVCPRYTDQIGLLRHLCRLLAAGDRASSRRAGGDREAQHDQTVRRRVTGHL